MLKPKYPPTQTYTAAPLVTQHVAQPVPGPEARRQAVHVPVRTGVGGLVQSRPGTALLVVFGAIAGVLALAAVAVSLLLAVAVTAVALAVSGLVVLFLVHAVRDELHR
ncbi:hypothetical protein [Streptomyces sp. NPDC001415]